MSTATYPLGMSSWNNRPLTGGYKTWKPTNVPVGITAGSIRPYSNKDYTNTFSPNVYLTQPNSKTRYSCPAKHFLPRPIKHFRKGRQIIRDDEPATNRVSASSTGGSLVKQMIDNPGSFSVNTQSPTYTNPSNEKGICVVADYKPNKSYLTENPTSQTQTKAFCCNEERKALRRARPANTNLPKTYFTTLEQYRVNRCQTFEQRSFNFVGPATITSNTDPNCSGCYLPQDSVKPGGPQMISNAYIANCQPAINYETNDALNPGLNGNPPVNSLSNPSGCTVVIYKPSNYKYAKQGAVSSSARLLNLNYATIQTNLLNIRNTSSNKLKSKAPACFPTNYNQFQNKTRCALTPNVPIKYAAVHRNHRSRNVILGSGINSL